MQGGDAPGLLSVLFQRERAKWSAQLVTEAMRRVERSNLWRDDGAGLGNAWDGWKGGDRV